MNNLPAIEIYSIGTELLMGQIQDTNAYWMTQQISQFGGFVRRITIIDDEIDEIVTNLKNSLSRKTKIIITTGGLGPTPDDLTVEAMAQLIGEDVIVNQTLIKRFMARRNIKREEDISPGLIKMATSPQSAKVHPNPVGIAPCIQCKIGKTTVFNLPGPPKEVNALFKQSIEEPISQIYNGNRALIRVAVNLPESEVGPLLHRTMQDHPNTYLKAYVSLREKTSNGQRLPIDIVARGESPEEARALLKATFEAFKILVVEKNKTVDILEK